MRGSQRSISPLSSINGGSRRDSDVSTLNNNIKPSDRISQLRSINSFLSSLSPPLHLKPPLPPSRDIHQSFLAIFLKLNFDINLSNLNQNLPFLLSALKCPIKLSKSALKAPSSPHAWPSVLSVLFWLVQLALVSDHIRSSYSSDYDEINRYITRSYSLFLGGDDCGVGELDAEYVERLKRHGESLVREVGILESEVGLYEGKVRELGKSRVELLEGELGAVMEDVRKFENVVGKFGGMVEEKRVKLGEREREMKRKEREKRRMEEENEELRGRLRRQTVSARDVERMKRELEDLEREIGEGETRRNEAEEKVRFLNSQLERKFREIESLAQECNQTIRKLKIDNNFRIVLNPKASSASEVLGIDYKSVLKPVLKTMMEEAKKSKVSKLEELINLQKQSLENDTILDGKRAHCTAMQTKINEVESQINALKMEIEDHALQCSSELEKIKMELTTKEEQVKVMEREAQNLLLESEEKLKKTFIDSTEDTRLCAQELYASIDSVTQYKEFMGSTIAEISEEIKEIAEGVKQAFESSIK